MIIAKIETFPQRIPNALSLPCHIAPEMVVGFGLTMGKLVLSGRIDEVVDTIKTNIRHI